TATQEVIDRLEEEKRQLILLMKRSAANPALLGELEREFARVEREVSLAQVADQTSKAEQYDPEAVVDACLDGLRRVCELWQTWPVQDKSRVQRLVFPGGVSYDAVAGNRTPQL